jgi:hypothetical protein
MVSVGDVSAAEASQWADPTLSLDYVRVYTRTTERNVTSAAARPVPVPGELSGSKQILQFLLIINSRCI